MLIDKVCGLNEMELNMKSQNRIYKGKLKRKNEKSNLDFSLVMENEIKKWRDENER